MIVVSMKRTTDGDETCNVKYNAPHEFKEPCIFILQLAAFFMNGRAMGHRHRHKLTTETWGCLGLKIYIV